MNSERDQAKASCTNLSSLFTIGYVSATTNEKVVLYVAGGSSFNSQDKNDGNFNQAKDFVLSKIGNSSDLISPDKCWGKIQFIESATHNCCTRSGH